ncbi:MAG: 50S ribosomal protein L15 [Rhizobiales bacterium NRL2]|jgi:large subunit ribosomal protein L15|nr:MAG: 50S ribosomal protein L15 [Rhizobiales bacterium NRL2]
MRLNELNDNPGSRVDRKRVGRGIGSGRGKTASRGQKGQKARSGVAIKGFEGGQMPIYRRLPKRGFKNIFRKDYVAVNIGRVQQAVDDGRLDANEKVNGAALVAAGVISRARDGVRLLAKGELTAKLDFEIAGASAKAVEAVEGAGGSVALSDKPTEEELAAKAAKAEKRRERARSGKKKPKKK